MLIRVLMLLLVMGLCYSEPLAQKPKASANKTATVYTCPMHPDVINAKRGKCPKCNMALRATKVEQTKKVEVQSLTDEFESLSENVISSVRIPDVPVQDQNGKSLNFYRDLVKGRVVAINFVFTTCTAICPSLTATFRRVQQQLKERPLPLNAQLISISVDPTTDTPERLHAFAEKFKAEAGWTFVTGNSSDIDALLKELGVAVANKNDHTPMILIGNDKTSFWTRTYGLSSPSAIVALISAAAEQK